ncbi:MAG: hypothetical protein F4223_04680 [Rhodobacteraceae bacterium]|nr:hypothetical protein [Paracoccaceae bacterium]
MNNFNSNKNPKHKTFISFHHEDDLFKKDFEKQWGEQFKGFVSRSVRDGDIDKNKSTEHTRQLIRDNFISDATVTLVLVGKNTWKRKHVDWEIASSIRDTRKNPRTGLLGLFLPTYSEHVSGMKTSVLKKAENGLIYNPYNIPPRLYDNIECGFAKLYSWPNSPIDLRLWIHDAFKHSKKCLPNNNRAGFAKNISETKNRWFD